MGKKQGISLSWVWMVVIFLGLSGAISFIQIWMTRQVSEVSSVTKVLAPEPVSKGTELPSRVNIENTPVSAGSGAVKIANSEVMAQGKKVTANKPAAVQESGEQSLPGRSAGQREPQEANVVPVNAPMTDQQILDSIQQQDEREKALQNIIAKRDATASQVMRKAKLAQNQPANNTQQVIPSNYPTPVPPEDIVAKLKSHKLTAH